MNMRSFIKRSEVTGETIVKFGGQISLGTGDVVGTCTKKKFPAIAMHELKKPHELGDDLRFIGSAEISETPGVMLVFDDKRSVETLQEALDRTYKHLGGTPLSEKNQEFRKALVQKIKSYYEYIHWTKTGLFPHTASYLENELEMLKNILSMYDKTFGKPQDAK